MQTFLFSPLRALSEALYEQLYEPLPFPAHTAPYQRSWWLPAGSVTKSYRPLLSNPFALLLDGRSTSASLRGEHCVWKHRYELHDLVARLDLVPTTALFSLRGGAFLSRVMQPRVSPRTRRRSLFQRSKCPSKPCRTGSRTRAPGAGSNFNCNSIRTLTTRPGRSNSGSAPVDVIPQILSWIHYRVGACGFARNFFQHNLIIVVGSTSIEATFPSHS